MVERLSLESLVGTEGCFASRLVWVAIVCALIPAEKAAASQAHIWHPLVVLLRHASCDVAQDNSRWPGQSFGDLYAVSSLSPANQAVLTSLSPSLIAE